MINESDKTNPKLINYSDEIFHIVKFLEHTRFYSQLDINALLRVNLEIISNKLN